MRIAVVFWSGSGNTRAMARLVQEGAASAGADVELIPAADLEPERVADFDAIAFGCPAMMGERVERGVFEPMFERCAPRLSGVRVGLFGSYGWGGGEWMRGLERMCRDAGAVLAAHSVICEYAPRGAAIDACRSLGAALASVKDA